MKIQMLGDTKVISVIVPVYNGEKWLNRCFEALQAQTIFEQLEIVIINDGSTDNSKALIDAFAAIYTNAKVRHISNNGVSNARNIGIEISSGEYIAFIDVDDYIDENYFEMLMGAMDSQCDMVCSGYIVEYKDTSIIHKEKQNHSLNNEEAIKHFLYGEKIDPNVWNKLFKRSVIGENRFNINLARGEDRCFVFDYLCNAKMVHVSSMALYHYVMNEDSVTHSELSKSKMDTFLFVGNYILNQIKKLYPEFTDIAECAFVDSECRMYGEIYRAKQTKEYEKEYKKLKSDIRQFRMIKKLKYSSKKHVLALLAAKISPKLYVYLKYGMKLQYTK